MFSCVTASQFHNRFTVLNFRCRSSFKQFQPHSSSMISWGISVDFEVIERLCTSLWLLDFLWVPLSAMSHNQLCSWEMGFGCHLYVRGVVPSAKHCQHIATYSVQARGTFVLTRLSLIPFHSIMFFTPFAALRVVCLCKSYCAGKFCTLTRISLLNAVCGALCCR